MPLAISGSVTPAVDAVLHGLRAGDLFPNSFAPEAALSGLWLYFGGFEQSHSISQDLHSAEGSYWHAILHRQEPDAGNAAYWFRRVGRHPVYPELRDRAVGLLAAQAAPVTFTAGGEWDPFAFIDFCECARRRPGSAEEHVARHIQLAEWQLLFEFCARPK